MRRLTICALLFIFVALLAQLSFAQDAIRDTSHASVMYEQVSYNKYQHGVVTNSSGVVDGVLLLDVNGVGVPIPGMKITIAGGDDFIVTLESDENGQFIFDPAEVGTYSAIVDYNGRLYSLDFKVTAYDPSLSAIAPDTGIAYDLKLVIIEDVVMRFAANRGTEVLATGVATPSPAAAACGAAAGGCGVASAGNFGMFAGALGAAGLATGIAALASSKDNHRDNNYHDSWPTPVSVGAPRSR